jgi:hypothetical protein
LFGRETPTLIPCRRWHELAAGGERKEWDGLMAHGISSKQLRSEQRRKRAQVASGLALGAKTPPKAIR